ncbi:MULTISPECIES: T9SS type A sorting domain-containing protein [Flavobacterium]|uniref:T9SS type A sorting domain-containing protein n=1 Tax=Flavobacterium jumunjinense TaxID=998845 RepID=A0ABV5GJ83_9FLAO|nr:MULTISPECIES: T9SS type A sorting domain-containing protein [Flavobacterium]
MKNIFLLFTMFLQFVYCQNPANNDPSFNISSGFNNNVFVTVIQNDDKIIVGGQFTMFQGITNNRLIRLNSDGTKDTSFDIGAGFNQFVGCISVQDDEKILVGGGFTTYQNLSYKSLIRLNSDGSIDNTFNLGTGFNGNVSYIAIQNDNKIIIGGNFTVFNGQSQNNVIRLNVDGTIDSSFNINGVLNGVVNNISIQNDGKIIVAGGFTTFLGQSQNGLIRFNSDGTKDASFDIGTGFNPNPNSTITQPDGKIIVSGWFTSYQGQPQNYLIRLNSDGTKDTSFSIGAGFNGSTYPLILQQNGKIIVGGQFTTYQNQNQTYLLRLNSDGSKDISFDIGTGFDNRIISIIKQSDEKIILGGGFTTYNGQAHSRLIRLIGDEVLSNSNHLKLDFLVYPNPIFDKLNILLKDNETLLLTEVYDISGKIMFNSNLKEIDLSNLNSGIYFLKVNTLNGTSIKKIIKLNKN